VLASGRFFVCEIFPEHIAQAGDAGQLLPQAVVEVLRDAAVLPLADVQDFFLQPLPFRDVGGDADNGVDFPFPVAKRRLGDDAETPTAVVQRDFVEHHANAGLEHLQVVGPERLRLLRRKNLRVRFAHDVFQPQMKRLGKLAV